MLMIDDSAVHQRTLTFVHILHYHEVPFKNIFIMNFKCSLTGIFNFLSLLRIMNLMGGDAFRIHICEGKKNEIRVSEHLKCMIR